MKLQDKRVAIVGLGLMGGSLSLALKTRGACREVIGIARRPETVDTSLRRGIVDHATTSLAEVSKADLIVLATPVEAIIALLPEIAQLAGEGAILLDLGSTKSSILETMYSLPEHVQPIGGHPMCGKETSGLDVAEANLYEGCVFVLTPLERTPPESLALVQELVTTIGALPLILEASRHDYLAAAVSHLPFLLACALVATAEDIAMTDSSVWTLAASGFRDTSRLAASNVTMMADILLTNRESVLEVLRQYQIQLRRLSDLIATGDSEAIKRELEAIRGQRRRIFP